MRKPKTKSKGKKPGGQPGNKNALRHGFYSKDWKADQKKRLDDQEPADLESEIALLRVCIDNLQEELSFNTVLVHINNTGDTIRDDHYLKQLNTLSNMTQAISTLARTQHLIKGKSTGVLETITNALEEMRIELGL